MGHVTSLLLLHFVGVLSLSYWELCLFLWGKLAVAEQCYTALQLMPDVGTIVTLDSFVRSLSLLLFGSLMCTDRERERLSYVKPYIICGVVSEPWGPVRVSHNVCWCLQLDFCGK